MKPFVRWMLVIIWMGTISIGSSIPASELPAMPSEDWLFWAHRAAHLLEYSVLGILLWRAYTYERPAAALGTVLFLAGCIFLFGGLDEWHQSFTPGRTPQLLDAFFDTISGTLGMLVYRFWMRRLPRRGA